MEGKRFILVALAIVSFGAATYAAGAIRRPAAPANRSAVVRSSYDPFTLQRKAIVIQARAQARIQGAVVRPPYRPSTRSPYQPPTRGPYLASSTAR